MLLIVAGWSFAEAILFFIVADVPISVVAARWGWRAGLKAALVGALAATVGGAVTYGWAAADPEGARAAILALPAIDEELASAARDQLASEGAAGMIWARSAACPTSFTRSPPEARGGRCFPSCC